MDIREAGDEMLIEELANRGMAVSISKDIYAIPLSQYSDTQLNNELSRRRHIHEKQYEEMMAQRLI